MKASKCKHYRFCNKQDWSSNHNAKINGKVLQQSSVSEGKGGIQIMQETSTVILPRRMHRLTITMWKCRPRIHADVQEAWHGKSWRVIDTILVHATDMKLRLLGQSKDPGRTRDTGSLQKRTPLHRYGRLWDHADSHCGSPCLPPPHPATRHLA